LRDGLAPGRKTGTEIQRGRELTGLSQDDTGVTSEELDVPAVGDGNFHYLVGLQS
jgi:hypothetical protein